jgi:hypothetical protein
MINRTEMEYIGGRSGGRLGAPQRPGGMGGRSIRGRVFRQNRHFGHGKSRVHDIRSGTRVHGGVTSHFTGGRFRFPMPISGVKAIISLRNQEPSITQAEESWPIYLPPYASFRMANCDIYTGNAFPPNAGDKRTTAQPTLITGVWPEGHRQKVQAADAYTHILLCDPSVEFRDLYKGQGNAVSSTPDYLAIPSRQTNNYWRVTFQVQINLPGVGRQRVVFADRWQTPGSYVGIP